MLGVKGNEPVAFQAERGVFFPTKITFFFLQSQIQCLKKKVVLSLSNHTTLFSVYITCIYIYFFSQINSLEIKHLQGRTKENYQKKI